MNDKLKTSKELTMCEEYLAKKVDEIKSILEKAADELSYELRCEVLFIKDSLRVVEDRQRENQLYCTGALHRLQKDFKKTYFLCNTEVHDIKKRLEKVENEVQSKKST